MASYIYKRNNEGVHIINLGRTWEKLMIAARVIAAIPNPRDILIVSNREYAQRAILKFATNLKCNYLWKMDTMFPH